MAEVTNLRQAEAKAMVVGIVSEKDLKVVTKDGVTSIEGHVTIKTDDTNFIKYNVKVNEKTKNGTDNKTFAGIKTVMEEYKSIAADGEEVADKVRVNGDMNIYPNTNTGATMIAYKSNFFNRLKADEEYEPKAEFSVEMFISAIVPEVNTDGDETGRMLVKGWVPTYNGIENISLVAPEEIAGDIESAYELGQTVAFNGDIVNSRIEKITEIPMKIGKPKKKIETSFKNELIITGSSEAYDKEEYPELPEPYNADAIKGAVAERDAKIAEAKEKAKNGNTGTTGNTRPSAAAKGRSLGF